MTRLFADSFYFFAVLNANDEAHQKSLEYATNHQEPVVTTAWVLTELADRLAATVNRATFSRLVARLKADAENESFRRRS